jgi:hypothetical protein
MTALSIETTLASLAEAVERDALETPGETSVAMRETVASWARNQTLGGDAATELALDPVVATLADHVVQCSTEVDLGAALDAGMSEDRVLEWVLAAAVGTAMTRLKVGLAALGRKR